MQALSREQLIERLKSDIMHMACQVNDARQERNHRMAENLPNAETWAATYWELREKLHYANDLLWAIAPGYGTYHKTDAQPQEVEIWCVEFGEERLVLLDSTGRHPGPHYYANATAEPVAWPPSGDIWE